MRGRVLAGDGAPLDGAVITVLNHPELGQTLSRADGMFDLAVNGGETLTIHYEKVGLLPAQRQVSVPWQDFVVVPDVALIPLDTEVTVIDLTSGVPVQVAQGRVVSDADGARQATLLFPQGVAATMVLPDGRLQALTTLTVRATEYTVGRNGPAAMPAALPPTSGYTYAVELSADEALAANARALNFSAPVPFYVENFLDFPGGGIVPVGYYDFERAAWIPSDNGRVVVILGIAGGLAELDIDGSGTPAGAVALADLGVTDAERAELAGLYAVGQSLWRLPITHFSPHDANWPSGTPTGATAPGQPEPDANGPVDDQMCEDGSIIGCENQTLGEQVGIAGTPFRLYYASDRVPGRVADYSVDIPLSGASLPPGVQRIDLETHVAGRLFTESHVPSPNLSATFTWDGMNAYGQTLQGPQPILARIGYVYQGVYQTPAQLARSFGATSGAPMSANPTRQEVTLWQEWAGTVGIWDNRAHGLGGWSLDVHHAYSPGSRTLYLGDGSRRSSGPLNASIHGIAGTNIAGHSGDGGPATQAQLYWPRGMAVGADGSLYVATDQDDNRIRRIAPDGTITTVAGTGQLCGSSTLPCGDGGPAVLADLGYPTDVAIGPDGSLYIADYYIARVRRVGPNGIITTVAGSGWSTSCGGDGGPATAAGLDAYSIAVGPDGSLYIAGLAIPGCLRKVSPDGIISTLATGSRGIDLGPDGSVYFIGNAIGDLHRVYRLGPDGVVSLVAGDGSLGCASWNRGMCFGGDGGPAASARLGYPGDIAVARDGTVYIADSMNNRVRRVGTDGIITTVAGDGSPTCPTAPATCYGGDGGLATQAQLQYPEGVAIAPDARLYVADTYNNVVRRVESALPGLSAGELLVPDEDGAEVYVFDGTGRHLRTVDALMGALRYQFTYDGSGRLASVVDTFGNTTTIERDLAGDPTAIVAPFGQRTLLTVNADGYLDGITNPANEVVQLGYSTGGLMTALTDPRSGVSLYSYDGLGRVIRAEDALGSVKTLTRTSDADSYAVAVTSPLGHTSSHRVERPASGERRRVTVLPSGHQTEVVARPDGTSTTTYPDGTVSTVLVGADPRFGMQAAVVTSSVIDAAPGIQSASIFDRAVTLADPSNPLSLTSLTEHLSVNGRDYVTTFTASTRTIVVTSPEGRQTGITLDALGRMERRQVAGLDPIVFSYDALGRLSSTTQGTPPATRVWSLAYDPSTGYLASVTDPLGRSIAYEHDAVGRVTRQVLSGGREIGHAYDANGNPTAVTPPGQPAHTFTYSPVDLRATYLPPDVGLPVTETQYAYDADRRPTIVTQPNGLSVAFAYDTAGRLGTLTSSRGQLTYGYDPATGKLASITAPGGVSVTYGYDRALPATIAWSGPVAGTVGRTFDTDLRVVSYAVNGADAVALAYDTDSFLMQAGALTLTRNPVNGLLTGSTLGSLADTWSYNGFGEPAAYTATFGGAPIYGVVYVRDGVGRVAQRTETVDGATTVYEYTYDVAGRLFEVRRDGSLTASYTYDANGNRRSGPGLSTPPTYDAQDRLTQYGGSTYAYGANGELQSKTTGGQTTTYLYDELGNLMRATLPGGTQLDYVIDGTNRRMGKKVNGILVQGFLYGDWLKPIAELDGSNAVVSRFVYAGRLGAPAYMVRGGATYRIITDHLGSPRVVTDAATGQIVQRMDYDELGNVTVDTNPGFQPFGFAGGLYDADTGLVRFGVRDYDAQTGRWTAKDPGGLASGPNLYAYANNDPVNLVDPLGNDPLWPLKEAGETMEEYAARLAAAKVSPQNIEIALKGARAAEARIAGQGVKRIGEKHLQKDLAKAMAFAARHGPKCGGFIAKGLLIALSTPVAIAFMADDIYTLYKAFRDFVPNGDPIPPKPFSSYLSELGNPPNISIEVEYPPGPTLQEIADREFPYSSMDYP